MKLRLIIVRLFYRDQELDAETSLQLHIEMAWASRIALEPMANATRLKDYAGRESLRRLFADESATTAPLAAPIALATNITTFTKGALHAGVNGGLGTAAR